MGRHEGALDSNRGEAGAAILISALGLSGYILGLSYPVHAQKIV